MKYSGRWIGMLILWIGLVSTPVTLRAESPDVRNCGEVATQLKAQNDKLAGDLRRIRREIAALRADLDKPGLDDIFSGIGYILGLLGTAAFVASRRRKE